MYSWLLVIFQLAALSGLVLVSPDIGLNPLADFISFGAIMFGLWSMWELNIKGKYSIVPDVPKGATLVTSGPYAYIRHPMYASVLLFAVGRFINAPTLLTTLFILTLMLFLFLKIRREEMFLKREFSGYNAYAKRTARLIPGVY